MTAERYECDLVVLAADQQAARVVAALLARPESLGIRPIKQLNESPLTHPRHDPGCLRESAGLLQPFARRAAHALVLFDRHGCGREDLTAEALAAQVRRGLESDWQDRAEVIVLDPELEVWLWAQSRHVAEALQFEGSPEQLRASLEGAKLWTAGYPKPEAPKRAVEHVLRATRTPRSAAIYTRIAERVSLKSCQDPSFCAFKRILQTWFPPH